jgi:DNA-binding SARP family transcriptional activator
MAPLILNLLGGFELRPRAGPPIALSTKTGQALLAYLALVQGQRHSRDKLAALLWEDRPDQQARSSLRQGLIKRQADIVDHVRPNDEQPSQVLAIAPSLAP